MLDASWAVPGRSVSDFGPNDALVYRFTTGSKASIYRGSVSGAEYGSSPSARTATLSASPCDFGGGLFPPGTSTSGNTVLLQFYVNTAAQSGYYATLAPNTTYYINILNVPGSTCTQVGSCTMFLDLSEGKGM